MLKRTIITTTITCLLAAIIFAEPEAEPSGTAPPEAEKLAPAKKQINPGQNHNKPGLLQQLREAYEQKDMDRIGEIIGKMEKRHKRLQAGRGQGQGRMKSRQWQGRNQRNRWQSRGQIRHWQGYPASQSFVEARGRRQWRGRGQGKQWQGQRQIGHWRGQGQRQRQGFAGPMRGQGPRQGFAGPMRGRGYGGQWQGRCERCGQPFAGPMAYQRAFPQGPQCGWGHQGMRRNFPPQRRDRGGFDQPGPRGGCGQCSARPFDETGGCQDDNYLAGPCDRPPCHDRNCPPDDGPMRRRQQRERSEWDW